MNTDFFSIQDDELNSPPGLLNICPFDLIERKMKGSSIDRIFSTIRCLVVIFALVIEGLEAYRTLRLKRYTKVRTYTFLKCRLCIGFHISVLVLCWNWSTSATWILQIHVFFNYFTPTAVLWQKCKTFYNQSINHKQSQIKQKCFHSK